MGGRGGSSGLGSKSSLQTVINNPPKLEGSEKQISWANDIRDGIIQRFKDDMSEFNQRKDNNPFYSESMQYSTVESLAYNEYKSAWNAMEKEFRENKKNGMDKTERNKIANQTMKKRVENIFEEILKKQTSAKWWIDRRNR